MRRGKKQFKRQGNQGKKPECSQSSYARVVSASFRSLLLYVRSVSVYIRNYDQLFQLEHVRPFQARFLRIRQLCKDPLQQGIHLLFLFLERVKVYVAVRCNFRTVPYLYFAAVCGVAR